MHRLHSRLRRFFLSPPFNFTPRETFPPLRVECPPYAHRHGHRRNVHRLRIFASRQIGNSQSAFAARESRSRGCCCAASGALCLRWRGFGKTGPVVRHHGRNERLAGAPRWTGFAHHHGRIRRRAGDWQTSAPRLVRFAISEAAGAGAPRTPTWRSRAALCKRGSDHQTNRIGDSFAGAKSPRSRSGLRRDLLLVFLPQCDS